MKFSATLVILAATAFTAAAGNPAAVKAREETNAFIAAPGLVKEGGTAQVTAVGEAPADSVGIQRLWCPYGFWCPDGYPYCNSCGWC
ncbi:hypothetical protein DFH27DRAFT_604215, partial [Peziza echinospora]